MEQIDSTKRDQNYLAKGTTKGGREGTLRVFVIDKDGREERRGGSGKVRFGQVWLQLTDAVRVCFLVAIALVDAVKVSWFLYYFSVSQTMPPKKKGSQKKTPPLKKGSTSETIQPDYPKENNIEKEHENVCDLSQEEQIDDKGGKKKNDEASQGKIDKIR
ncbi:hypothetical protein LOK49_LG10G00427 [Camellia lanceoleosa]|uniref:Uncharacterized protein n=1 Tax=Camellia lanceoleosa TaxID=1840588 RepID=A0ACC0GBY6_9ERIC|nr:hypothetical protein LOK49_LG10G00427 [Camellia lanceoleosa]